jgi:hypothetical protein
MKIMRSMVLAAAIPFALPALAANQPGGLPAGVSPGPAAVGGTELILYRFPGVFDNGGNDNTGQATSFHCTNFSGGPENIRFVTRAADGTLLSNAAFTVNHLVTFTASTHLTQFYTDITLATGAVQQGTVAIAATTTEMICTAVTIDALSPLPAVTIPLRGIRYNPSAGSQE